MAPVTPVQGKSFAVQLDEAAAAIPGFKIELEKAEAAKGQAFANLEAAKQKVRDLHAKLMASLGDIVPSQTADFRP